jgi:iron complex outermembrane recepter protein
MYRPLLLLCVLLSRMGLAEDIVAPELVSTTPIARPAQASAPPRDHVVVEFTITAEALVQDIVFLEGVGEPWDGAVRAALSTWTFKPARHEGAFVSSRTRLQVKLPVEVVDAGPDTPDAGLGELADEVLPDGGHAHSGFSTTVSGRTTPRSRGASDFSIEVGALQVVPRQTGADFLKLAPGFLLTNEGGEGHPERIFLRGFDAREGQDLELTVGGVPVNESGNQHANGFADLNFVIPEVVSGVRVIEGPFDPRQGNYAVAGSADYELGLVQRGLTAKGTLGTFNSQRLSLLWGPPREPAATFAAVSLSRSDGFGQNRGAQSARLMAQIEANPTAQMSFRLGFTGYGASFRTAGVVRQDDFEAGRLGFYDSVDPRQGGDSARFSVTGDIDYHRGGFTNHHQLFLIYRGSRLMENFTGFLLDDQKPRQAPHGQRGDLIDRESTAFIAGARGYGRLRTRWSGRPQELELGYFARLDVAQGQQQRVLGGPDSTTPYLKDFDLASRLTDIGLYVDANVAPLPYVVVRGGVRGDLLTYTVDNFCAVDDVRRPSQRDPPGDASCLNQRDFGLYREPTERQSAVGAVFMPRVSLLIGPWQGLSLTGSFGDGIRSIDPQFITANRETPFASIRAWEGGLMYADSFLSKRLEVSARAVAFGTRVDKDLIFNQQEGRNLLGGATNRVGGLVQARARGGFFDVSAHATAVSSRFEDTGLAVPYVPEVVVRADAALFGSLALAPFGTPLKGALGVGTTFVGRRALPFGQRSDVIFTTDVNGEVSWRMLTIGVAATNLFNAQYRLGEFNYASDFRLTGGTPTLVPTRHFTAGAPRQLLFTVSINLGAES